MCSSDLVSRAAAETIVVPRSAVLDTGTRKIVYVAKSDGVFEAREVALGTPSDDLFPVVSGLSPGDKVVLSGNFLLDSQAHLSSGMSGLYGGSKEFAAGAAATAPSGPAGGAPPTAAAKLDLHAPTPLKAGEDNVFTATLTDAGGKPISDAQVKVTLVMPAMPSMGMPEMRSSFDLAWNAAQHAYAGKGQPGMTKVTFTWASDMGLSPASVRVAVKTLSSPAFSGVGAWRSSLAAATCPAPPAGADGDVGAAPATNSFDPP